jgi:hypothetical protein
MPDRTSPPPVFTPVRWASAVVAQYIRELSADAGRA